MIQEGRRKPDVPGKLESVQDFGQLTAVTIKVFAAVIFTIFAAVLFVTIANHVGGTWRTLNQQLEATK